MGARKMQFFVIVLLLSNFCHQHRYQTNAYVTIQIEPEDIQNIGDILMQFQQHRLVINPQSRYVQIIPLCKSFSRAILQMMGIMLTLVGANVLTSKLESFTIVPQVTNITTLHKIRPSQLCPHEFGCDGNLCWRTCDGEKMIGQSWCYTSKKNETEFQKCNFSHECSPCWDCLTSCEPI